jgi:hypothetical protein
LEECAPVDAAALYREAIDLYESDGKEGQAGDVFRQAVALLVKRQSWGDAVAMLMHFGEVCDKTGANHSQSKAYLGAVVVWLYAGDVAQAWKVSAHGTSHASCFVCSVSFHAVCIQP